jgi:hypothetical protein
MDRIIAANTGWVSSRGMSVVRGEREHHQRQLARLRQVNPVAKCGDNGANQTAREHEDECEFRTTGNRSSATQPMPEATP